MKDMLKWILCPGSFSHPCDSGGGGDGGAGKRQAEEERRKARLRARIDRLYGIKSYGPSPEQVIDRYQEVPDPTSEEGRPMFQPVYVTPKIDTAAFDAETEAAARQMEEERTKLGEATRAYYADQLGKKYADTERATRFNLARRGLLGGSQDVVEQGEVKSDRDLGATRVDEAVRRAISTLQTQREQERLNAVNLVNAGAGDSAVSAAQAGLRNTLENVSTQQKADIFSDLFAGGADAMANQNVAAQQAALAARYRDRLSSFFPSSGSSSGRVTPSS